MSYYLLVNFNTVQITIKTLKMTGEIKEVIKVLNARNLQNKFLINLDLIVCHYQNLFRVKPIHTMAIEIN